MRDELLAGMDPLPRCFRHGACLVDGGGELLEPPCGCRHRAWYEARVPVLEARLATLVDELRAIVAEGSVIDVYSGVALKLAVKARLDAESSGPAIPDGTTTKGSR